MKITCGISKIDLGKRIAVGLEGSPENIRQNFDGFYNHGINSELVFTYGKGENFAYFVCTKEKLAKVIGNRMAVASNADDISDSLLAMYVGKAKKYIENMTEGDWRWLVAPTPKRGRKADYSDDKGTSAEAEVAEEETAEA